MTICDHELMDRIRERDADAFEALAARHRDALTRHLLSMVRDPGAADDLLQEVLLRVWTRAEQWDARGAVHAWLFRIATNLALNYLRTVRRRREVPLELPADARQDEAVPVPAWMVDAASARPEQQAMRAERSSRIRRLVGALPADKREVVTLAAEESCGLREIAERLGIPEGTAKSRLHYARKWLADQWIAYETEGEDWL